MSTLKTSEELALKTALQVKKFYGINWTLEDFVLEKDVVLPNGIILPAGTRHFAWKEAMALQRIGAFPDGYRLPTAREIETLVKNVGALTMYKRLNFKTYRGFLDRACYNSRKLLSEGRYGYYWSSSSGKKHNAIVLEILHSGSYVYAWKKTSYRDYGNSIRLVYDPQ